MNKWLIAALLPLLLSACAVPANAPGNATEAKPTASSASAPGPDASAEQLLGRSSKLILEKKPMEALPLLNEAIAYYEKKYREHGVRPYSARSPAESLLYLGESVNAHVTAKVYGEGWGLAYFGKGFALVDLQRVAEAKVTFDAAIELSPHNSRYLSERGHVDALEHNWPASLDIFRKALDAAEFSPPNVKTRDTTRALRGMAFAQVELKALDAAEALHKRVLQLDPNDAMSLKELRYIQTLRTRPPLPTTMAPAGSSAGTPKLADAIWLYGTANYFRVLTKQRRCDLMDAPRFNATNERLEGARQRLAARFGDKFVAPDQPVATPILDRACDQATLMSYQNHVLDVESLANRLD